MCSKRVEAARAYLADDVPWYNTQHKHSGIALFSPAEVHDGSWKEVWKTRDQALQRYYNKHPERFHQRPTYTSPSQPCRNQPPGNKNTLHNKPNELAAALLMSTATNAWDLARSSPVAAR